MEIEIDALASTHPSTCTTHQAFLESHAVPKEFGGSSLSLGEADEHRKLKEHVASRQK